MQPYLTLNQIQKKFGQFVSLKGIDLQITHNEFVCLLGPSGCGKTTLLRIIAGLETATTGSLVMDGKDITKMPAGQRDFAMMFQSYALFPNLTAYDNIAYGLSSKKLNKREIRNRVDEVLDLVNLSHLAHKYPGQCSGGQQQRIALARALAMSPKVLLLDEPLSALDAKVRDKLRKEIRNLHERLGMTTIMVTHDQEEALTMADKIVVMNNAEIVQIGTPQQVYEHPNSPFVADFIGAINFMDTLNASERLSSKEPMTAIRPEHIHVGALDQAEAVQYGRIQEIEFRGSFYRLTLQCMNSAEEPEQRQVMIDISSEQTKGLQLTKEQVIPFRLPRERIITFHADKPIVVNG
ncbi:ABC transporter ATP-binding protein [Paenibacillus selenitireducens]|uniref:ABC transporter ATP-binding protein n=1 Tax=Paenibacillus selenitireducens TaxID=1324314 RepID=A0A1T2XCR8_9BACL|nr:putative 2-aminoethylphosphonate ABC transporter ATP-binding protein [Paenibacillus selenitireducens]OPA77681.1 ABC transporter ATP-binding protein [Paenibacillus selenitireducens]